MNWRHVLPLAAFTLLSVIAFACGSGGNNPEPTRAPTVLTQHDHAEINELVSNVITNLILPGPEFLEPLLDASVPTDNLSALNDCWPMGGGIEIDEATAIAPQFDGLAIASFQVTTIVGIEERPVDYEWDVRRQPDGSWLLAEPPDCPFS